MLTKPRYKFRYLAFSAIIDRIVLRLLHWRLKASATFGDAAFAQLQQALETEVANLRGTLDQRAELARKAGAERAYHGIESGDRRVM